MIRKKELINTIFDLKNIWMKHPELRLGQLLWNVFEGTDTFYLPNKDFIEIMEEWSEKYKTPKEK